MSPTKQLLVDKINRVNAQKSSRSRSIPGKQRVRMNAERRNLSDRSLIFLDTARKDNEIKRDRVGMASSCDFTAALREAPRARAAPPIQTSTESQFAAGASRPANNSVGANPSATSAGTAVRYC